MARKSKAKLRAEMGARIVEARKAKRLRQEDLASACGVSVQAVSSWERGVSFCPAISLWEIAQLTRADMEWLVSGKGELQGGLSAASVFAHSGDGRHVPLVDWINAPAHTRQESSETIDFVTSQYPSGVRAFALRVGDDANAPELSRGDTIIIDPDEKPKPGDMVLVLADASVVLRKFRPRESTVELEPLNSDWPRVTVNALTPDNFLGVMTESTRPRRR